jgi:hypothetical protein
MAEEAGISFTQNFDDTVFVDGSTAFADLAAARGTGVYFLGYGLPACGTQFHGTFPRN